MSIYSLSMKLVETIEQELLRECEAQEAWYEASWHNAPLPEDLEHPEKLLAETRESIDEFVRCVSAHLAYEATINPGTISPEEAPLLEAITDAGTWLFWLFRRVEAAGLDRDELSTQLSQGARQALLACGGGSERQGFLMVERARC